MHVYSLVVQAHPILRNQPNSSVDVDCFQKIICQKKIGSALHCKAATAAGDNNNNKPQKLLLRDITEVTKFNNPTDVELKSAKSRLTR